MVLDSYIWVEEFRVPFQNEELYYNYPVSLLQAALGNLVYLT